MLRCTRFSSAALASLDIRFSFKIGRVTLGLGGGWIGGVDELPVGQGHDDPGAVDAQLAIFLGLEVERPPVDLGFGGEGLDVPSRWRRDHRRSISRAGSPS